jgi:hypothetical protein
MAKVVYVPLEYSWGHCQFKKGTIPFYLEVTIGCCPFVKDMQRNAMAWGLSGVKAVIAFCSKGKEQTRL